MSHQTKITGQKKHNLKKKPDTPGFNQSFFTVANTLWYNYAVNWLPHKKKPLLCLPCANANKTRAKYGKKMFSHSTTHQFLSAITRCENFESEKPELKPVSLEKHIKARGRYTNRKFWEYINVIKKINTSKKNPIFQSEKMPVALKNQYFEGFLPMYPMDAIKTMKEGKVY